MGADSDYVRLSALTETAERALREQVSPDLRLRDPQVISARPRSLLLRCATTGWGSASSVVIKQNLGDDERGFSEWAALAFLSQLGEARGVAPRFYTGDAAERILVMEDLGGSSSLEDVLYGRNGAAGEAAVVRILKVMASSMATLVGATLRKEHLFHTLRVSLPGATGLGRESEAERWFGAHERLSDWCDRLDLKCPAGLEAVLEDVARTFARPEPYLSFSHGDPAPSNNHIADDCVRLVDFEYAGYRHLLYDITAWHILCPLPGGWVREMDAAFRRALLQTEAHGLVADESRYRAEWATMCAYRAVAMFTWFPSDLLDRDHQWTPGWTGRQAMISTAIRLHDATACVTALTPLAELGASVAGTLRRRWPEVGNGTLRWPGVVTMPSASRKHSLIHSL